MPKCEFCDAEYETDTGRRDCMDRHVQKWVTQAPSEYLMSLSQTEIQAVSEAHARAKAAMKSGPPTETMVKTFLMSRLPKNGEQVFLQDFPLAFKLRADGLLGLTISWLDEKVRRCLAYLNLEVAVLEVQNIDLMLMNETSLMQWVNRVLNMHSAETAPTKSDWHFAGVTVIKESQGAVVCILTRLVPTFYKLDAAKTEILVDA